LRFPESHNTYRFFTDSTLLFYIAISVSLSAISQRAAKSAVYQRFARINSAGKKLVNHFSLQPLVEGYQTSWYQEQWLWLQACLTRNILKTTSTLTETPNQNYTICLSNQDNHVLSLFFSD
jgi:hypothetical protein